MPERWEVTPTECRLVPTVGRRTLFRMLRARGRCHYCHKALRRKRPLTIATIDHILPKSKGGSNAAFNVVACCSMCNQGRATTGHCILGFVCAKTVLGDKADIGQINAWWHGLKKKHKRKKKRKS